MNETERMEIARKLSDWYCKQNGTEPWLRIDNKKYVSMVSLFDKNFLSPEKWGTLIGSRA
ncbi:hypothetical protein ES706_00199 [subsurface metagenome]